MQLHIVCLDVPFPVDYGGVVDPFYKIKTLHQLGVLIHLHCFEYGRGRQPELDKYCVSVDYYQRSRGHKGLSHKLPYIVCSRSSPELAENLLKDEHPILLEGIHCSYILNDSRFENRKMLLRLHNVEWVYYRQQFHAGSSWFRKAYYLYESKILKRYERSIARKTRILAVSELDAAYYRTEFEATEIDCLPVFVSEEPVRSKEGTGCYCLYHGNLSVAENEKAVAWLLGDVFNELDIPLVIAGKKPSARLEKLILRHRQACLVSDPSDMEMQDIIAKAQVHVLPAFSNTGIKLKLLNALYNGRHCLVNEDMVRDTGLEGACHIGSGAVAFRNILRAIYPQPFSTEEIASRKTLLASRFNNLENARKLIQWIW
jgi:hypothetical protein